jgi:hypothetical protein
MLRDVFMRSGVAVKAAKDYANLPMEKALEKAMAVSVSGSVHLRTPQSVRFAAWRYPRNAGDLLAVGPFLCRSWHTPPGRVLAVWLDGVVEFEVSDGEVRHVSAGGSVLVEDTHGKGHISRHPIEGQNVILISLPNGLDPLAE